MLDLLLNDDREDKRFLQPLRRRQWLRLSGLAGLLGGRPLDALSAASATSHGAGFGRAKSVIVVFASGGQSQLETWDPKPHAPREIRGQFDAITTSVPGTLVGEHMPRLAQMADRYTIIRSMSHEDLDHGSASYLSLTGRYHARRSSNPPPSPNDHPNYGAVFKRLRPNAGFAEPAIQINGPMLVPTEVGPGQDAGFLGREFEPMTIGDVTTSPIVLPGLSPQDRLPQVRLDHRRALVEQLDEAAGRLEHDPAMRDLRGLYGRAFEMLQRPATRNAFDLSAEPVALRQRYGMNRSGQACLLARRLVEAGVPLITVFFNNSARGQDTDPKNTDAYGWDTHNDIFTALQNHLLPRFDLAFSALLEDLENRGLLDDTLVLCLGEFGRAPRIAFEKNFAGTSPGRKHWAAVYSMVAAGAGVLPGKVLGRSNRIAGYPDGEKYSPADVIATIFASLGIDPAAHFTDPASRPFAISNGRPIHGLFEG